MSRHRLRIASVVGARPQFVKAAVVAEALAATARVDHVLIHTGQHYDAGMSDVFFRDLGMAEPDHLLGIGSGRHGAQTGAMLEAIERILLAEQFDWIVVYGDTNSTLAGALAAAKLHVRVAHVEAGLRSFNRRMPEEVNRVLTDHASDLLFTPTDAAVANLASEGIADERVVLVGDVMFDAALKYAASGNAEDVLNRLGVRRGEFVLTTVHRAENTDDAGRLRNIVLALSALARDIDVVIPIHPRTRKALTATGLQLEGRRLRVCEPIGYLEMLALEAAARVIATDSGGVQKEAFFQRVPCITLRDETEWTELVQLGWNRLVAPSSSKAIEDALRQAYEAPRPAEPVIIPYGGGRAATRIADRLLE